MKKLPNEYELVVSEGRRPLWMICISAVCFTVVLYGVYETILTLYNDGAEANWIQCMKNLEEICSFLGLGIASCVTKTVLIDTDRDILVSRFCVGPIHRDVKSKVPQLEYVSVFFDAKEQYQVNLWYIGNKHYKMYVFDKKGPAMEFGMRVALKLNIDLLDATEKGNSLWIDIPNV